MHAKHPMRPVERLSRESPARDGGARVVTVSLGVAAIMVALAVALTISQPRAGPPRERDWSEGERQAARKRFISFAKKGFSKTEAGEATDAFVRCFRKGDEAVKYAEILAKGRRDQSGELTTYEWFLQVPFDPKRPDSSSRLLSVFVKGDPQRIELFYYSDSMD